MSDYHDFFLSYTWVDNDRGGSGLPPGWVDRFEDALLRELRDLWWQQIKHFRDCNKIRSGKIKEAIDAALRQSISLVCLISNDYFTSDWGVDELRKMWAAIGADGLLPSDKTSQRIVPVLLGYLPKDRLGLLNEFRYLKAFTGSNENNWKLLEPSDHGEGRQMVREVAMMIKEVVRQARGKGGPLYGQNGKVFLSASPDLEFNRLGLQASFEDYGFPVVPGEILPSNEASYAQRITEMVTASRASVHGFGNLLPEPVGKLVPLHYEFEIARTACAAEKLARSIVWIPEDWETTVRSHRDYVQNMENDDKMPANVSVYRVSFPELKNVIRDTCRTFGAQQMAPVIERRIYFIYRLSDESDPHWQALAAWVDNLGMEIGKPILKSLFVGDPAHLRDSDHIGRQTSSNLLVYCGQKADTWAGSQYLLLKSSPHPPARQVFYITAGTTDFVPPPNKVNPMEPGPLFDPAWADQNLRPFLTEG